MPLMPSEESLEVLLVDDELSTREILEQFCRSRNLAVTVASDGRAAMTAIERNPIALHDHPDRHQHAGRRRVRGVEGREGGQPRMLCRDDHGLRDAGQRAARGPRGRVRLSGEAVLARSARRDARAHQGSHRARTREPRPAAPARRHEGRRRLVPRRLRRRRRRQPCCDPPCCRRRPLPPRRRQPRQAGRAGRTCQRDMANRVGTMEERLARMEELLRAAITPR